MRLFFNRPGVFVPRTVNTQFAGSMFTRVTSSTNCSSCSGAK